MRQPGYVDPGQFIFSIVFGTLASTLLEVLALKRLSSGEVSMYPPEQNQPVPAETGYGLLIREEEPVRDSIQPTYERMLPYWETYAQIPVEMVGHSVSELGNALNMMERSLASGQQARIQLLTSVMPTQDELDSFFADMRTVGFHTSRPVAKLVKGIPSTEFTLRKGSPVWSLLIPLIPVAIIGGLIVFGITRIETISKALFPLLLVTVGGIVITVALLTRRPVLETARAAIERRERVPRLPRTIPLEPKKALAAS